MKYCVTAEQMDFIDLIRGVITRTCAHDNDLMKENFDDKSLHDYYEGKVTAWNSILYYLDRFEVPEEADE